MLPHVVPRLPASRCFSAQRSVLPAQRTTVLLAQESNCCSTLGKTASLGWIQPQLYLLGLLQVHQL